MSTYSVMASGNVQASWARTVSDQVLGAGTGSPIDRIIATCALIADRISRSISPRVLPAATHPGRSAT